MQNHLKIACVVVIAVAMAACEEHRERNQDAPAADRVPPGSEKGTMPSKDPLPPQAPSK